MPEQPDELARDGEQEPVVPDGAAEEMTPEGVTPDADAAEGVTPVETPSDEPEPAESEGESADAETDADELTASSEPSEPEPPASTNPPAREKAQREKAQREKSTREKSTRARATRDTPVRETSARPARRSHADARTVARVSGRVVAGIVAVAASVAVVAGVSLLPLPTFGAAPEGIAVKPVPGDEFRVCAGAALRFGTEQGTDADTAFALGSASVVRGSLSGGTLTDERLTTPGAEQTSAAQGPLIVRGAAGSDIAAAQLQNVSARGYSGLATTACLEPNGSAWLVGGATTVGRTTLLTLINPSEVDAVVTVRMWTEAGEVSAPGMAGISVPASSRRVVSLSAYAPNMTAPVVEVTTRGGRIAAFLQQSIVRGLDAGGTALIAPSADPATTTIIPGVRILAATRVASAVSGEGWDDAEPVLRVLAPDAPAEVSVTVTPADGQKGQPTSFVLEPAPGEVMEIPLNSGVAAEQIATLDDGVYTVTVESDEPVVAAVRASTATEAERGPTNPLQPTPRSDFAWFSSAPVLPADVAVAVTTGPNPVIALTNPGTEAVTVTRTEASGATFAPIEVPAGATVAVPVTAGVYRLSGTEGLLAQVSYAGTALLGSYPVIAQRPLSGPVIIHV